MAALDLVIRGGQVVTASQTISVNNTTHSSGRRRLVMPPRKSLTPPRHGRSERQNH